VPAVVKPGGVVCWSGATLHQSHANRSRRPRRAYAVHFVAGDFVIEAGAAVPPLEKYGQPAYGSGGGAMSKL
jgi:ectoine hydroxylase-related dioxygenase (phytanoyl-CoA dioxygenase family)